MNQLKLIVGIYLSVILISCITSKSHIDEKSKLKFDCDFEYLFIPDTFFHSSLTSSYSFINYKTNQIHKWGSLEHFFSSHQKIDSCRIITTHVLYRERGKSDTAIFSINFCDPQNSFLKFHETKYTDELGYFSENHFDTLEFHFKREVNFRDTSVMVYRFSSQIEKKYHYLYCVYPIGPVFYYDSKGTHYIDYFGKNATETCLEEISKAIAKDSILTFRE